MRVDVEPFLDPEMQHNRRGLAYGHRHLLGIEILHHLGFGAGASGFCRLLYLGGSGERKDQYDRKRPESFKVHHSRSFRELIFGAIPVLKFATWGTPSEY